VRTSTIGSRKWYLPATVSWRCAGAPLTITATSVEVPPMSNVITFGCPSSAPRYCDAVTPPDGPERRRRIGALLVSAGVITLPLESSRSRFEAPRRSSSEPM